MIQKGKTMIQNSRLEDKESLLNRDFIEKRKEDFLLTLFFTQFFIYYFFVSLLNLVVGKDSFSQVSNPAEYTITSL